VIPIRKWSDDFLPRLVSFIKQAMMQAAQWDHLKQSPSSAVAAAQWVMGGINAIAAADKTGLLVRDLLGPSNPTLGHRQGLVPPHATPRCPVHPAPNGLNRLASRDMWPRLA